MKKFLTIVFTLSLLVLPLCTVFALDAANDLPTGIDVGTQDLKTSIGQIVNIVLSIMGLIFFILFVVAGFKWMTAAGNEDAIESAKSIMTAAVIGLIITLLAWAISYFVLNSLNTRGIA